LVWN